MRAGGQAGLAQLRVSVEVVHIRSKHDPKDTGVGQRPRQVGVSRGASHRVRRRARATPPRLAQRRFQGEVPLLGEGGENPFSSLEIVIWSLVCAARPAGNLTHGQGGRPALVEQVATDGEDRFAQALGIGRARHDDSVTERQPRLDSV